MKKFASRTHEKISTAEQKQNSQFHSAKSLWYVFIDQAVYRRNHSGSCSAILHSHGKFWLLSFDSSPFPFSLAT